MNACAPNQQRVLVMAPEASIRLLIANVLSSERPETVGELASRVLASGRIEEDDFVGVLKSMIAEEELILGPPSYEIETFLDYLFSFGVSMWFWVALALTAISLVVVTLAPDALPLNVIRLLVGSVFILSVPGYSLTRLLFPETLELKSIERYALAVGLSIALVMLTGLGLNFTPLGIRLFPIIVSLTVFTALFSIGGAFRQYLSVRAHPA